MPQSCPPVSEADESRPSGTAFRPSSGPLRARKSQTEALAEPSILRLAPAASEQCKRESGVDIHKNTFSFFF
jgi:hypothetical protein